MKLIITDKDFSFYLKKAVREFMLKKHGLIIKHCQIENACKDKVEIEVSCEFIKVFNEIHN